jgi:hypothetical protein
MPGIATATDAVLISVKTGPGMPILNELLNVYYMPLPTRPVTTVGEQAQVCFCQEMLNLTGFGGPRHRYCFA